MVAPDKKITARKPSVADSLPLLLSRATILADVPRDYAFLQNRARGLFQTCYPAGDAGAMIRKPVTDRFSVGGASNNPTASK
jgi:hypothetical protein